MHGRESTRMHELTQDATLFDCLDTVYRPLQLRPKAKNAIAKISEHRTIAPPFAELASSKANLRYCPA